MSFSRVKLLVESAYSAGNHIGLMSKAGMSMHRMVLETKKHLKNEPPSTF